MSNAKLALAALVVAGAVASVQANAFTYDNRTNQNADGTAKFRDADGNLTSGKIGNSHFSMQFSGSSSGYGQSGIQNRFVPSSNSAFSSPFDGNPNNLDLALGNRH